MVFDTWWVIQKEEAEEAASFWAAFYAVREW